jgi:DNA-binding Xre family transcriptional regulator
LPTFGLFANPKKAERGQKAITMNALASEIGVAATTITRLARTDAKGASSLPLDLAGKILTVLEVGIGDLLDVVVSEDLPTYP